MNIIKKYMFGMILKPIMMIGIWTVVIFGMTIFFHLLFDDSTPPSVEHINGEKTMIYYQCHIASSFCSGIILPVFWTNIFH
jgi:hypothetical protein